MRRLAADLGPLAPSGSGFDDEVLRVEARAARWVRRPGPVLDTEIDGIGRLAQRMVGARS